MEISDILLRNKPHVDEAVEIMRSNGDRWYDFVFEFLAEEGFSEKEVELILAYISKIYKKDKREIAMKDILYGLFFILAPIIIVIGFFIYPVKEALIWVPVGLFTYGLLIFIKGISRFFRYI